MHYIFQSSESVLIIFATRSYADHRMRESLKETSENQGREVNSRKIFKKKKIVCEVQVILVYYNRVYWVKLNGIG